MIYKIDTTVAVSATGERGKVSNIINDDVCVDFPDGRWAWYRADEIVECSFKRDGNCLSA